MYKHSYVPDAVLAASKRMKENSDCTVKALAVAYSVGYEWAHAVLKEHGRKNREGIYTRDVFPVVLTNMGIKHRVGPYSATNKVSLKKFCEAHPKGRYVVTSSGHAMAVIDGVVYDWGDKPRRMVKWAVRIYKEGE